MAIDPSNPDTWPVYSITFEQDIKLPTTYNDAITRIAEDLRQQLAAVVAQHPATASLRPSLLEVVAGRRFRDRFNLPEPGLIDQAVEGATRVQLQPAPDPP
jgi:hypothetical protein